MDKVDSLIKEGNGVGYSVANLFAIAVAGPSSKGATKSLTPVKVNVFN